MNRNELIERLKLAGRRGVVMSRDLAFFIRLKGSDAEMAGARARRIAERICRELFELYENQNAGSLPLERVRSALEVYVPKELIGQISLICEPLDVGAPDQLGLLYSPADTAELAAVDLEQLEFALISVCEFYCNVCLLGDSRSMSLDNIQFELKAGADLTYSDLEELYQLARSAYGSDVVPSSAGFHLRHAANPETYISVIDPVSGQFAGFLGAVPLDRNTFLDTLSAGDDATITNESIASYRSSKFVFLHLSTVVVDWPYRDHTLVYKLLRDGFISFLSELAKRDVFVVEISANAITENGNRICRSLGMEVAQLNETSTVYSSAMLPPRLKLRSKLGRKLLELYRMKYNEYVSTLTDDSLDIL